MPGDDVPGWATGYLASFAAGSRVAGYRLEAPVGQGGMAVVFRAFDERLERQVALKILAPAVASDEAFRRRFIRESRMAAAVDDPHIIPVFEAGDADGVLFIAMRYVPGGDARTLVQRAGPLPAARAAGIISAAASALDAAHAAGLVHRDVKPANMLVDARPGRPDHVYLSDFGLTKAAVSSVGLTSAGQFLGTLDYSAPEQIEGRPVDGRTDEYALACAAFELLSGAPPFVRDEGMAVAYAQVSAPPPRLTSLRPDLHQAADAVLARAMAKSPGDRYPTCREFADALRAAIGLPAYHSDPRAASPPGHPPTEIAYIGSPSADPVTAPPAASPPGPVPGPAPGEMTGPERDKRRRRAGLAGAAAVAVLAAAGGVTAIVLTGASAPGSGRSGGDSSRPPRPGPTSRPATGLASSATPGSASTPGPAARAARAPRIVVTLADPGGQHVNSVAFSPDGREVATGDANGNAYLWSAATGQRTSILPTGDKVFAVAFSPDGTLVATGDKNGSTGVWSAATGSLLTTIRDPGGTAVNSVAFSPDGQTLATGDENGHTYLWRISAAGRTARPTGTLTDPAGVGIWAVAFSPDGARLATGDYNGSTYAWNVASPGAAPAGPYTMPGGDYVTAVAFSPDSATLATADYNGNTYLWNLSAGGRFVIGEPNTVWGVAFSRNGTLAIGDEDGTTYLWNAVARRQTATLTDPGSGSQGVGAVAFSPNGRTLAAGDTNGSTYLWKIG